MGAWGGEFEYRDTCLVDLVGSLGLHWPCTGGPLSSPLPPIRMAVPYSKGQQRLSIWPTLPPLGCAEQGHSARDARLEDVPSHGIRSMLRLTPSLLFQIQ